MRKVLLACLLALIWTSVASGATGDLTLTWTAPGDDGNVGTADLYDIRWSLNPINIANWDSASVIPAIGEPTPLIAGTTQEYVFPFGTLPTETLLFFRIIAIDDALNASLLSNEVSKTIPDGVAPQTIIDLTATIDP